MMRPVYLDCNATTPIEASVRDVVISYLEVEYGNAGSRTHVYGLEAKKAVDRARAQVAAVVGADRSEVIFTSGATESNNLALFGIAGSSGFEGHIVSTQIEHKAVLEPLSELESRGCEVTLVRPTEGGWVDPGAVLDAVRTDTRLVSIMHANNETGVVQPIGEIADALSDHGAYLHVDAAQGFGKDLGSLKKKRIDLISVSGHKMYAPMGVGALITRRRGYDRPPLSPRIHGGGQERGLRPGTLPVPLIAGLGKASELALRDSAARREACLGFRTALMSALAPLHPQLNGDEERILPHVLNISFPGLDSEAVMLALKDLVAVSNGSACTSQSYEPSHVLVAMRFDQDRVDGALRFSWSHLTPEPDLAAIVERIQGLM